MTESLLIDKAYIRTIRTISNTINQERLDSYIFEVQRNDLRTLLGDKLYFDMFTNITDAKYISLISGADYDDITFYGLKIYIAYKLLASMSIYHSNFITNIGSRNYSNNELTQQAQNKNEYQELLRQSQKYRNDIITYLDFNSSDFPLWIGNKKENETSLNIRII